MSDSTIRRPHHTVVIALCAALVVAWSTVSPIAGRLSAAATFKRGVSIGNWLAKVNANRPYGGPWFGQSDIVWIAQQGFDHIRYPVDGRLWLRADGTLDDSRIAPFEQALAWGRANGLSAVLDMHFLPGGTFDANAQGLAIFTDEKARAAAADFWGKVAQRLVGEGPSLRFEVINEPMAPRNDQLNALNSAALAAIRKADPARVVYITSNLSSTFATLADVVVPADPNVGVLLHYDEPLVFSHQRASWKHFPANFPLISFPGTVPDLSEILPADHEAAKASKTTLTVEGVNADFAKASAWLKMHASGHEVYLGEFGVYEVAPAESRRTYIAAVRGAAERNGWGWAIWDYRSSFAVRAADGSPTPVLAGLFDR